LAGQFSDYFVNFIRTGDPNGGDLPVWQPSRTGAELMELGSVTAMRDDPFLPLYAILDRMQGAELPGEGSAG
jgi:para-nitrobenzyl esterase